MFTSLATQWRLIAGLESVVYVGLNYPSIESVLYMTGVKRKKMAALLSGIRIMEASALGVLNKRE